MITLFRMKRKANKSYDDPPRRGRGLWQESEIRFLTQAQSEIDERLHQKRNEKETVEDNFDLKISQN